MISALAALALATAPATAPATTRLEARAGRPAVILAPRQGPRAALVVRFWVGSVDDATADGSNPGLTHLAQLALVRANARLDALGLVKDVFASDGELAITTGLESCEFRLEAASAEIDPLAERLLAALFAPSLLGGDAFEAVREKALHDRREGRGGAFTARLARVAVPEAAYGTPPHGDRDSLERLTAADVRRHVARYFVPANATVAWAGAFDARRAEALSRRWSGGARLARRAPALNTPFGMIVPASASAEAYLAVFRRPGRLPAATWLLAAVLDERLDRLREHGLGYSHGVEVIQEPWLSGIALVAPVSGGGGLDVLREVEGILAELRAGPIAADELERNRQHALAAMEALDRDPGRLAVVLSLDAGGPALGADRAAALAHLEREEVSRAAAELLDEAGSIRILFSATAETPAPLSQQLSAARGAP